jgi:hypothetical protein
MQGFVMLPGDWAHSFLSHAIVAPPSRTSVILVAVVIQQARGCVCVRVCCVYGSIWAS